MPTYIRLTDYKSSDKKDIYYLGAFFKNLGKKWFIFSKINSESFEMIGKLK